MLKALSLLEKGIKVSFKGEIALYIFGEVLPHIVSDAELPN